MQQTTPTSRGDTLDRVIRLAVTAGIVAGGIWLLGFLSDVLIPFAVAVLMAYIINPLVVAIEARIKNRNGAVLAALALVIVALLILTAIVVPLIAIELTHMGKVVTELVSNSSLTKRAAERLPPNIWEAVKDLFSRSEVKAYLQPDGLITLGQTIGHRILPGLWSAIRSTGNTLAALMGLVMILLYLIFVLFDYQRLRNEWQGFIPPAYRQPVLSFLQDFEAGMHRYFRAQALVAALVGLLHAVGFSLIGLPLAIVMGLFIGVLNMIPYMQILGIIPAFLLASVHGIESDTNVWVILALTAAVFVVVQLIQDLILVPRIMGKMSGLSPAMILLSLSIWGKLLGVFGLLIAIPMTCLLIAWYTRYLRNSVGQLDNPETSS